MLHPSVHTTKHGGPDRAGCLSSGGKRWILDLFCWESPRGQPMDWETGYETGVGSPGGAPSLGLWREARVAVCGDGRGLVGEEALESVLRTVVQEVPRGTLGCRCPGSTWRWGQEMEKQARPWAPGVLPRI